MSEAKGPPPDRRHPSAYAQQHLADWVPVQYDGVIYAPDSQDTFIWSVERPVLQAIAASVPSPPGGLRYLDFACGTGRIVAALEQFAGECLGVDISPQMLSLASAKVRHAQLRSGDLLETPDIAPGPYDLITAMRFFLNTEEEMRRRVMPALAALLAGPDSRLVFNIHGNTHSLLLTAGWRKLHRWPPVRSMTFRHALGLVRDAGLEVVDWYGFGLFPDRLYRGPIAPVARWVDRKLAGRSLLRWISRDMVFVCRLRPA